MKAKWFFFVMEANLLELVHAEYVKWAKVASERSGDVPAFFSKQ